MSENEKLHKPKLLCIDDSRSQLTLFKSQLSRAYQVAVAANYEESIAQLSVDIPDLILLDMNMPGIDGLEFLDILRYTPRFKHIPVMMVSADQNPEHVKETFRRGASDFIHKPYDSEELDLRIQRTLNMITQASLRAIKPEEDLSSQQLMIQSLADLAGTRDNETGQHLIRIEKYVEALAAAAAKSEKFRAVIDPQFVETVTSLAKLHDIGKVSIPDHILHKPAKLTAEEFEIMKTHTTKGAETIERLQESFPSYQYLETAKQIILYHHERWDGNGYPEGLAGEDIPLCARIIAIADVFDAITMKRVYKTAQTIIEAFVLLSDEKGTHFDPDLIEIFLSVSKTITEVHNRYADIERA